MGSPSAACRKGMVRATGGMQKDLYRVPFWTILWIFERPLGDERADVGRSRRHGWIRAGRVRPRIAPRGPGFIWEPFVEVRKSGTSGHPPYKAPYQSFQFVTRHSARPGLCPEPVFQNVTLFG